MPKIVDHDARRIDILVRSLGLFAERGYAGLSMRSLATGLGVSTGTVYHYFSNKASLFEAMMRHLGRRNVAQAIADLQPELTREDRLAIFRVFMEARADSLRHTLWVAIDHRRSEGADAGDLVKDILGGYQDALTDLLAAGDRRRGRLLLYMLLGILVYDGLHPDEMDIGEEVLQMMSQITGIDSSV